LPEGGTRDCSRLGICQNILIQFCSLKNKSVNLRQKSFPLDAPWKKKEKYKNEQELNGIMQTAIECDIVKMTRDPIKRCINDDSTA